MVQERFKEGENQYVNAMPTPSVCTTLPFPPAKQHSTPPPMSTNPHPPLEPVDTTGRACIRGFSSQRTPVPFSIQTELLMTPTTPAFKQASLAPTQVVEVEVTTIPRTTAWHQKKNLCFPLFPPPPPP